MLREGKTCSALKGKNLNKNKKIKKKGSSLQLSRSIYNRSYKCNIEFEHEAQFARSWTFQYLWDDEQSVSERLHTQLSSSLHFGLVFHQGIGHGHLKGTCSWYNAACSGGGAKRASTFNLLKILNYFDLFRIFLKSQHNSHSSVCVIPYSWWLLLLF